MSGTVRAIASHTFRTLSAEQVFRAWVDPVVLRDWMDRHTAERDSDAAVTRIDVDTVVGGRFFFADTREGSETWGVYRAIERPRRIVFTWFTSAEEEAEDNSVVTIDIVPMSAGSQATITHEMDAEWADYVEQTANAWRSMMEAIDKVLG